MNEPTIELFQQGTATTPLGFDAGVTACGLKPDGALDLAVLRSDRDATVAGTFTQNQFAAAPVLLDRATLAANRTRMRAVVANAGNANACTGEQGDRDAAMMQRETASALGLIPEQILVLSTGVIGVPLPMKRLADGIRALPAKLSSDVGLQAARAIMTTDTRPKHASVEFDSDLGRVRIGGIAKGSGMIHPNMATMLAVLTTDARVSPSYLQAALEAAVGGSFNAISVDGDTSTNDTVVLLANGASGVPIEAPAVRATFQRALSALCADLAKKIVRDGEGATRFVEVHVTGLGADDEAHAIAEAIATSPLVKTAFAGGDPNWGRILAAAGRAGVRLDPSLASLTIEASGAACVVLVRGGTPTDYSEADAAAVFAQHDFRVHLSLGSGPGQATMWTTDLTHGYVELNADYRS